MGSTLIMHLTMSADTRVGIRYPDRGQLTGPLPNPADYGVQMHDFAEEAFDQQIRLRPEIGPEDLGGMLRFVHDALGLSTLDSTSSYAPLGRLLGDTTDITAEQMMKRGTDYGNPRIRKQIRYLFAAASLVERRAPDQPGGEGSLATDRRKILQSTLEIYSGMSVWDLFRAKMPDFALAALQKANIHNEEQE